MNKENQETIDEAEDIKKAYGFICDYVLKERGGKDPVYSFRLSDNQGEDPHAILFSGFKNQKLKNGDYIVFKWKKSSDGNYNNVKYILKHENLSKEPNFQEAEAVTEEKLKINPEIKNISDLDTIKLKADIMCRCIEYGIKNNDIEKEIIARYNRICMVIGIE